MKEVAEKSVEEYMDIMEEHKRMIDQAIHARKVIQAHLNYRQFVKFITSRPRKKKGGK